MRLWRKNETRESVEATEAFLSALLNETRVTRDMALNIPSFSGCVEFISNAVASLPIKLFEGVDGEVQEVKNDKRIALLNDETGDTLNALQMKKAFIRDYLIDGNGYIYINRNGNKISSLHYVDSSSVSVTKNEDPIFKAINVMVQGKSYMSFDFLKITRNTKDGFRGSGILAENQKALSVAYNSLTFEEKIVKKGGNKKGFIKSQRQLTKDAMDSLKEAWNNLYSNNENVVIPSFL